MLCILKRFLKTTKRNKAFDLFENLVYRIQKDHSGHFPFLQTVGFIAEIMQLFVDKTDFALTISNFSEHLQYFIQKISQNMDNLINEQKMSTMSLKMFKLVNHF